MGAYVADQLSREASGLATKPFRFRAPLRCVSLGRDDAIVQVLRADESPAPLTLVGRPAAKIKESICRMTVSSLASEGDGVHFKWTKGTMATAPISSRNPEDEDRQMRARPPQEPVSS